MTEPMKARRSASTTFVRQKCALTLVVDPGALNDPNIQAQIQAYSRSTPVFQRGIVLFRFFDYPPGQHWSTIACDFGIMHFAAIAVHSGNLTKTALRAPGSTFSVRISRHERFKFGEEILKEDFVFPGRR